MQAKIFFTELGRNKFKRNNIQKCDDDPIGKLIPTTKFTYFSTFQGTNFKV